MRSCSGLSSTSAVTHWSRGLLEKLTVAELVRKFPIVYGTWNIVLFTIIPSMDLVLSQTNPVHTLTCYVLETHFNIILYVYLGLKISLFLSGFPTDTIGISSSLPRMLHSSFLSPIALVLIWRKVQIMKHYAFPFNSTETNAEHCRVDNAGKPTVYRHEFWYKQKLT
jgi:hypothetical protein